jgi:hypothetical protein
MAPPLKLRACRLRLHPWHPADREPFAALNVDPEKMAFSGALVTGRKQCPDGRDSSRHRGAGLGRAVEAAEIPWSQRKYETAGVFGCADGVIGNERHLGSLHYAEAIAMDGVRGPSTVVMGF